MSDDNREILSRLMDGEWGDLDPSQSVADACASPEQQRRWARYHLARDAMRGDSVNSTFSIADSVSAAIADEPTYSNVTSIIARGTGAEQNSEAAPAAARSSRWGLPAAGLAVAASAALATVFGLNYFQGQSSLDASQALIAGTAAPVIAPTAPVLVQPPAVELVSNRGSYWVSGQNGERVGAELRLNQLLGDHIEHSPTGDWRGMLPYSRLVGYDTPASADQ